MKLNASNFTESIGYHEISRVSARFSRKSATVTVTEYVTAVKTWIIIIIIINPFTARPEKNNRPTYSQCMGNSQYCRQHYITYHGYKYSLYLASPDSVAGFIRQSGIIIYFLHRKYPAGKAAKGLICQYLACRKPKLRGQVTTNIFKRCLKVAPDGRQIVPHSRCGTTERTITESCTTHNQLVSCRRS